MNLGGNLVVNNGIVSTKGTMNLGSATITNGSAVSSSYGGGGLGNVISASGNVLVDDSSLEAFGSVSFASGSSLTMKDDAQVNTQGSMTLGGPVEIDSGQILAPDMTYLDAGLTVQLQGGMTGAASPFTGGEGISIGGGSLVATFPSGFTATPGEQFQLFNYPADSISGTFGSLDLPSLPGGESWNTSQLYTTGIISVVPEPTAIGLMLGAGALLIRRRRKI
jgi:hypothetical protein